MHWLNKMDVQSVSQSVSQVYFATAIHTQDISWKTKVMLYPSFDTSPGCIKRMIAQPKGRWIHLNYSSILYIFATPELYLYNIEKNNISNVPKFLCSSCSVDYWMHEQHVS